MGSAFSKDKNIDIYLHTDRQYYFSGDYVQGEVYLNAKTPRAYSRLVVRLQGEEYISWDEGSGEDSRRQDRKYKNYDGSFVLRDFQGKVEAGQYVFPFSMLLPAMITGSFYNSYLCYLKYILRVELEHSNPGDSQFFEMFLNIIEPPRGPQGPISITNHVNSKCCKCCCDYGMTSVTLKADKNFVQTGDTINISGVIDNSAGSEVINGCALTLREYHFMARTDNYKVETKDNEYALNHITQPIGKGATREFSFPCRIPDQITSYTAIGRIVGRYFVIHLDTDYGCCANRAQAVLHIVLHSRRPKIVEKKIIPAPAGWNPRVEQRVTCNNLAPYVYNPLPIIPFLNMPTNSQVVMQANNGGNVYPPRNLVYPNMGNESAQQINQRMGSYEQYQPVYYNSNIFPEEVRQQQGYQPYFGN